MHCVTTKIMAFEEDYYLSAQFGVRWWDPLVIAFQHVFYCSVSASIHFWSDFFQYLVN